MTIQKRMDQLEDIVEKHLMESGTIKTNLKWNTVLTGIILTAVIGRYCVDFFFKR